MPGGGISEEAACRKIFLTLLENFAISIPTAVVHHGGGLLLLGGSCGGDNSASGAIWQFEKYQWTKRRDRLALPRKAAAAFEVPGCME